MEKISVPSADASRLASLIEHRLRGEQQLFLVSIGNVDNQENADQQRARSELLALIGEMHGNVTASGVAPSDLDEAIDVEIRNIRSQRD